LFKHYNPSVSHTLDSSPYTGEPLEIDFVNTLKVPRLKRGAFVMFIILRK